MKRLAADVRALQAHGGLEDVPDLPVRGDHAAAKGLRGYRVKLELPVQQAQRAFRVQWVSQVQQVQPEKWGLEACRA